MSWLENLIEATEHMLAAGVAVLKRMVFNVREIRGIVAASSQTTWKELGYPPRVCAECGSPMRLSDISRIHFDVASRTRSLRCKQCGAKIVEGSLRAQRALRSVVEADAA